MKKLLKIMQVHFIIIQPYYLEFSNDFLIGACFGINYLKIKRTTVIYKTFDQSYRNTD